MEQGDIVGRDAAGNTIIQLSVNDYVLETLMAFDADAAELEQEPDDEEDSPPVLMEPRAAQSGGAAPGPDIRLRRLIPLARRATIPAKVNRQLVESIPSDDEDIECMIQGFGW